MGISGGNGVGNETEKEKQKQEKHHPFPHRVPRDCKALKLVIRAIFYNLLTRKNLQLSITKQTQLIPNEITDFSLNGNEAIN